MPDKTINYPKHWEGERYQPLVEAETIYGNMVKIPKRFLNCWQTAKMIYGEMKKRGLDHLDFLKSIHDPRSQSVVEVCFEVYKTKN